MTQKDVINYYKIHDLDLVGKVANGVPLIYINHEWTLDIRLLDRIYGYDETEHDTCYAMGNDEIMRSISIISEETAMEFIKRHQNEILKDVV